MVIATLDIEISLFSKCHMNMISTFESTLIVIFKIQNTDFIFHRIKALGKWSKRLLETWECTWKETKMSNEYMNQMKMVNQTLF